MLKDKLRANGIILIACVCGWFVMELEILGVRVLSPYFGSAVYVVMGSVIGVFLLSLSAGYMLGGWLTRKSNSPAILGASMIAAGAWLLAMPIFIEPVCEGMYTIGLDEKWGSLLAAVILFGTPTILLGTATPVAVRWLTKEAHDSGLNTGVVLAFSTAASFAGCLVTAFYLVLVSMRQTLRISGIILAVTGIIVVLKAVMKKETTAGKQ